MAEVDYSKSGLTIRSAMLRERGKGKGRPPVIRWGDHEITTVDVLPAPGRGRIEIEILSCSPKVRQAVDVMTDGSFLLADGRGVDHLRTWHEAHLEPLVSYEFKTRSAEIRTWNVYEVRRTDGRVTEEKWTENAGMWIEVLGPSERRYHCSQGMSHPPDFSDLVYRIAIREH